MLLYSLGLSAQNQEDQLTWLTNLEEAKSLSKEQNKTILVYFTGSDWCSPCKMLKEDFFSTEEFKLASQDLILVMVDYPRRVDIISQEQLEYNKGLIDRYNKDGVFPKLLALNARGKERGMISGYSSLRDPSSYFAFIGKYLPTK